MYGGLERSIPASGSLDLLTPNGLPARKTKPSWSGVVLFFIAMLVAASAFPDYRIQAIGLLVHPYLVPTALLFGLFLLTNRLKVIPGRILLAFFLFTLLYVISALPGRGALGESIKFVAAIVTVITVALLIRTEGDVLLGIVALCVAAALISLRGLQNFEGLGIGANALSGIANENATSLYTLPALLLAGYALRDMSMSKIIWWTLALCMILIGAATFLSANRSGWLGVFVVGMLLMYGSGKNIKMGIVLGMLAAGGYYLFLQFDASSFFYSIEATLSRKYTDTSRLDMFTASFWIGFENPLIGVSPTELPYEIGTRLFKRWAVYSRNPHNVIGHLIGGSGFITFGLFLYLGSLLWRTPKDLAKKATTGLQPAQAHWLLRMMIILWLIRGMFSHEILYNPAFCIGLGVVIGLCLLKGVWPNERRRRLVWDRKHIVPKKHAPGVY